MKKYILILFISLIGMISCYFGNALPYGLNNWLGYLFIIPFIYSIASLSTKRKTTLVKLISMVSCGTIIYILSNIHFSNDDYWIFKTGMVLLGGGIMYFISRLSSGK
ncbi:MAG: hypothetical protein LBH58_10875 [Tannerellaceae bacterium]|jgi:hypothetical protein|nr:hypothetical protein [Tannerellaceae bacterium]